ncbi:MAG: type I DNA topoisomerase [Bacteroidales bacterium]|nr:type I DNA topoisomerase [Bacteroidales bacterium]
MSKNLIIVESPAKAKTIQKFISKDYTVISSKGHVRDLPEKDLGIEVDHNFLPQYQILAEKKKLVADIKKLVNEADTVWLATDDDREGEAISWHLMQAASIPPEKTKRIVFHEITKTAIDNALANPRQLDVDLVNAQQARRILDRLVGFELSPVLWRKVLWRKGKPQLSAGRVQSVAVKLIVERERKINQFKTTSAYRVVGRFSAAAKQEFDAELNTRFDAKEDARAFLQHCVGQSFRAEAVENSPGKKVPAPPFTTSTMQQEAARKLGFSVSKTMSVAQQLYEAGYITYMRTDSVNLSDFALAAAQEEIVNLYGKEYAKTRKYQTKSLGAQEAHEAIRPTSMANHTVPGDSFAKRLYELIWKRTLASQMSDAKTEKTTITIPVPGREEKFVATGEVVLFQGFLKVYIESKDEEDEEVRGLLPAVTVGDALTYSEIKGIQKFAQPPVRYTEASLVKKLEELGIGRPSTYAPTISTIQKRDYVVRESRSGGEREYCQLVLKGGNINEETKKERFGNEKDKLFPTDIGIVVNEYLQENFDSIMDYSFTAKVEKEFDDIAEGHIQWQKMLQSFYTGFHESIDDALINSKKASGERLLGEHPKTGEKVYAKLGKFGPMAQIGDGSDDKKPRYARLRPDQSIESITLDEAIELFKLPRVAGQYEEKDVTLGVGRFGPYIKFDNKFVSVPKGEDPNDISLERCIELIELKRKQEVERAPRIIGQLDGQDITAAVGRFGPYLKYADKNYTLEKGTMIADLTLEQAIDHIRNSKNKNVLRSFPEDETIKVMNGRYGAYITNGTDNFKLPKGTEAETLTLDECRNIIANTTPSAKKRTYKKSK